MKPDRIPSEAPGAAMSDVPAAAARDRALAENALHGVAEQLIAHGVDRTATAAALIGMGAALLAERDGARLTAVKLRVIAEQIEQEVLTWHDVETAGNA